MRKLIVCGVGLVAALVLTVPGAFGGAAQTPGVTAKTITIGGTFPLTGTAAPYAPIVLGHEGVLQVHQRPQRGRTGSAGSWAARSSGRYYDDGYNPANTVQLTRRLVEQDKVFATSSASSGPSRSRPPGAYINQQKVPQVLVATGASYWGTQYKEFPWTIGWQPDYIAEGRMYGLHIKANHRGKKIAIIYQNDDYGKDYLYGLPRGAREAVRRRQRRRPGAGRGHGDQRCVADGADQGERCADLRRSSSFRGRRSRTIRDRQGARVQPRADLHELGRGDPAAFLNGAVAACGGARTSTASIHDRATSRTRQNPTWDNDAAHASSTGSIMAKYAPRPNASNDGSDLVRVAKAETFVQALYKAGKNPTRAGLMNALLSMNTTNGSRSPASSRRRSKTDHFIMSQMRLQRFNNAASGRRSARSSRVAVRAKASPCV